MTTTPLETKTCTRCGETKPRTEFYTTTGNKDGREAMCKPCRSVYSSTWQKKHRRITRNSVYRKGLKVYGLTPEAYNALVEQQGGRCAICNCFPDSDRNGRNEMLAVDHDHVTGKVRGLLCMKCNHLLGNAADRIEILRWAALYLGRYVEQGD